MGLAIGHLKGTYEECALINAWASWTGVGGEVDLVALLDMERRPKAKRDPVTSRGAEYLSVGKSVTVWNVGVYVCVCVG